MYWISDSNEVFFFKLYISKVWRGVLQQLLKSPSDVDNIDSFATGAVLLLQVDDLFEEQASTLLSGLFSTRI